MSDEITRTYSNGEIEVIWRAGRCVHSAVCFRGLPQVFDPRQRPWVHVAGAATADIVRQVEACPSGALSYARVDGGAPAAVAAAVARVEPLPDGPLRVQGDLDVVLSDGTVARRTGATSFCRCGASANKPFCDGSHSRVGFQG